MKKFLCLLVGISLFGNQLLCQVNIENPISVGSINDNGANSHQNRRTPSVYLQVKDKGDFYEIKFGNSLSDTIYLFDSYMTNDLIGSKYLHRYNKKQSVCKLSLVPIVAYLSIRRTDRMVLGHERVRHRHQILYSFKTIPPNTYLCINILKSVLDFDELIEDFDDKRISKFDNIKFKSLTNVKCDSKMIELAFYKDISKISDIYYVDEFNFDTRARAYNTISITLTD